MPNKLLSFKDTKILVIGDVMLDVYNFGKISRMSPECDAPILKIEEKHYKLGGAANVAANVAELGAKTAVCSVIGSANTTYSDMIAELMDNANINHSALMFCENRKTTAKIRNFDGDKQILRIDEEDDCYLDESTETKFICLMNDKINDFLPDAIILQDYNKGVLSENVIVAAISIAKTKNIKICVDPKKLNFDKYSNIDLFKPNLKEFCEYKSLDNKTSIETLTVAMKDFMLKKNINIFMLTMSDKGILILDKSNSFYAPTKANSILDVAGAGDTAIAVATLLLVNNASITSIALISNAAAGVVCQKKGISTVSVNEIKDKIENYSVQ